jgi:hypothetical protein
MKNQGKEIDYWGWVPIQCIDFFSIKSDDTFMPVREDFFEGGT